MNASFILSEDLGQIVEHWCYGLPPGVGVVDSLTELVRGLMKPPRFVLHRERVELFSSCPALALSRRVLTPRSQALLVAIEEEELRACEQNPPAHRYFNTHRMLPGGEFAFSDFVGDEQLATSMDAGAWIEALARALWEGGGDFKYEVTEVCRCALSNALLLEPVPEVPPDVIAMREKYTEAVDVDMAREEAARSNFRAPFEPPTSSRRVSARFLRPMPKPRLSESGDWNPYGRSDALEAELEHARKLEAPYLRARDLRAFVRRLIERVGQWN